MAGYSKSYPIIGQIEFVNAERTRAAVQVTVGYSGATVQMQKQAGRLGGENSTNFWITECPAVAPRTAHSAPEPAREADATEP